MGQGFEIAEALDAGQVAACRELFLDYQRDLGISLCFQGFDAELAALPGRYAPPQGALLLASVAGEPAGCVALRPVRGSDAEMKRLFVRPPYRAMGMGRALAGGIVDRARILGYRRMFLDTLPRLREAVALYASMGFRECEPYDVAYPAEVNVRYFVLEL